MDYDYAIYVDLDSLFDTRYVTYGMLAYDDLNSITLHGFEKMPYFKRIIEETPYVDHDEFFKVYGNRDKNMLIAAQPTEMLDYLSDILIEAAVPNNTPNEPSFGHFIINTYPYKLTIEEEEQLISDILNFSPIPTFSAIETINLDPMQINQGVIKKHKIKVFASYDARLVVSNLSEHHALDKNPMRDVTFLAPAISMEKGASSSQLFTGEHNTFGPFGLLEIALGVLIDLKFLNGEIFSGVLTKIIKKEEP